MPRKPEPAAEGGEAQVRAVVRAARILKAFRNGVAEAGVSELARRVGLSPATAHRIANTLISEGFLEQDPATGRYRLGAEVSFLGLIYLNRWNIGEGSRPIMQELADQTGETVSLGVLRDTKVMYLQQVESSQPIRAVRDIGLQVPLHCTAQGKVLLAFAPAPLRDQLLAAIDLQRYTASTITHRDELAEHLEMVRERGYVVSDEEYVSELRGLAVPVRDHSGAVVAALSVMGPSFRLTIHRLTAVLPQVLKAAERISRQLGWSGQAVSVPDGGLLPGLLSGRGQ